jgi:hypothetical protein
MTIKLILSFKGALASNTIYENKRENYSHDSLIGKPLFLYHSLTVARRVLATFNNCVNIEKRAKIIKQLKIAQSFSFFFFTLLIA